MKLQQLRYIVEVASCGSVTEAARRLFVSQPSVTAAVRDLEREMGITVSVSYTHLTLPTNREV